MTAPVVARPAVEGLDKFLSHISHELRTPLSAIMLWAKLLDELGRDPDQMREAVAAIQRSAGELQLMIEDLIDMSRVLTGKVRITPQPTPIETALQDALSAVKTLSEEHQVSLSTRLNAPGAHVHADPQRLAQILRNLLRHAIDASPLGGSVSVSVERHGRDLQIAVSDSGPGLPPQLETHVFDPVGIGGGVEGHPASGVALAVVRRLVELHQGRLHAHSGPGPGTTYTVRLPADPAEEAHEPFDGTEEVELPVSARPLQGRHILLVEDSSETRRALNVILSEAGAQVTSVNSSSAALTAFKRGGIDLVVSDLGLPKMDGYEMMQQFRRWERLDAKPSVPALALTAYAGEGTRRRALHSGYHGCLTKPVDPARLIGVLTGLVRNRREHAS